MTQRTGKRGRAEKWTQDLRRIVYARIVMEFGPYDKWGKTDYPDGREQRYEDVLAEIAAFLSRLTGTEFKPSAVRQQVNFGRTRQQSVFDQSRARTLILNKAAALEMGFIHSRELPSLLTAVVGADEE